VVTEIELFESTVTHSRLGCCCLHKQTWRSTQMKNTRYSHTCYKVH